MEKLLLFLYIISLSIFHSCTGDTKRVSTHITRTYFNNSTSYMIKLLPYKNGLLINDNIKIFAPNSINLFESNKFFMPDESITFGFTYQQNTDSIIVAFDNIKKEKHRVFQIKPNESPYLPNQQRSLYSVDQSAFLPKIINQRKNFIEVEFTYTFTEQDYLDAEFIK